MRGGPRLYFCPMSIRSVVLVTAAAAALACTDKEAPSAKGPQPVQWAAEVANERPSSDGSVLVDVRLRATIKDGWHVYSLTQKGGGPTPLSVKVDSSILSIASPLAGPAPEKAMDPNFGVETETYTGQPVITVPVKVSAEALKSGKPIDVKVKSQACSDKLCPSAGGRPSSTSTSK